jgi:hypothetical protein
MTLQHRIRHAYRVARSFLRERAKRKERSPRWEEVARLFLREHSRCAACGGDFRVQVHHVKPFHLFPSAELEESNLLPLCMSGRECHLLIGHGDDFRCWNPHAATDAEIVRVNPDLRAEYEEKARKLRRSTLSKPA